MQMRISVMDFAHPILKIDPNSQPTDTHSKLEASLSRNSPYSI
jgi:hypothetical protein